VKPPQHTVAGAFLWGFQWIIVRRMGDTMGMTMITSGQGTAASDRLGSLALTTRQRFMDGNRMTVRRNGTVHAVEPERWVGGELIPQPLCHTAVYGWSPEALRPTKRPVNCQRCIRKLATPEQILLPSGEFQPPLFSRSLLLATA
jgi:hypothetical protein